MSAGAALRWAQAVSGFARQAGCTVDEATEALAESMSRRRFLAGAGAAATMAAFPLASVSAARSVTHRATRHAEPVVGGRVVVVGGGIAGLGCAHRLWQRHRIRADIYEYDTVPGGRIRTLRGFFGDGQLVEQHAEFINPEHTATLSLASQFGLTLDNADRYPPGTRARQETMRFGGMAFSQAELNREWHDWGWQLFHDAAFTKAPWPTLYNRSTAWARTFDKMSVAEWIDTYVPGGMASDFGHVCVAAVLDEFGGPADQQSSLNLVYLLGQDASRANSVQPHARPQLAGADEKWHIHGGNDQLISGLVGGLPAGAVHLDQQLIALRSTAGGSYSCTFQSGAAVQDVVANHVVLALPFTTLRLVDLGGVSISPLHRRAISEEPLGTNSKLFLQFTDRVWNTEHWSGNVFCSGVVQGGWDPTIYQTGPAGDPGRAPGGHRRRRLGPPLRIDHLYRPAT